MEKGAVGVEALKPNVYAWSPLGTAVLFVLGGVCSLFIGGYFYNYAAGSRGVEAIPLYKFLTHKLSMPPPPEYSSLPKSSYAG
jgi:hypothetical protein